MSAFGLVFISLLLLYLVMMLQETDNPGTTMEEYVQFETERALRNGKVYNWETAKNGMVNWCLDEGNEDIKEELDDGKWSTYVPNDEWKRLELEKMPPSNASYECIGEYGLMINDDDLEHMFDYLLAKDGSSFMDVEKEEMERMKSMMIGTPSERAENLDKKFDDWARDNGFVNTSGCDDVELVKK
ncbi:hypothetical protein Tco_0983038 [Tanacetum coccineum]